MPLKSWFPLVHKTSMNSETKVTGCSATESFFALFLVLPSPTIACLRYRGLGLGDPLALPSVKRKDNNRTVDTEVF